MSRPNPIDLLPEALRLPVVILWFVAIIALALYLQRLTKKTADEVAAALQSLGWSDLQSRFFSRFGHSYDARLMARRVRVEYGVPDRSQPLTIRVTFPTGIEDSFEVRRKLDYSATNLLQRPLWAPKATTLPGRDLQVRGQLGLRLSSSEPLLTKLQSALTNADDFIAVRRGKAVINLTLPKVAVSGRALVFPYRPPAYQIETRAREVDDVARTLFGAGM